MIHVLFGVVVGIVITLLFSYKPKKGNSIGMDLFYHRWHNVLKVKEPK